MLVKHKSQFRREPSPSETSFTNTVPESHVPFYRTRTPITVPSSHALLSRCASGPSSSACTLQWGKLIKEIRNYSQMITIIHKNYFCFSLTTRGGLVPWIHYRHDWCWYNQCNMKPRYSRPFNLSPYIWLYALARHLFLPYCKHLLSHESDPAQPPPPSEGTVIDTHASTHRSPRRTPRPASEAAGRTSSDRLQRSKINLQAIFWRVKTWRVIGASLLSQKTPLLSSSIMISQARKLTISEILCFTFSMRSVGVPNIQ